MVLYLERDATRLDFGSGHDISLPMTGRPPRRLASFFERSTDAVPDSVALVTDGVPSSYAELDAASASLTLDEFTDLLVWGATGTLPTGSPWWLAVLAPHTTTPFDLLHTLGVSAGVLGVCMMLGTIAPAVVRPLALVGSMPLTMYAAHLVLTVFVELPLDAWPTLAAQVMVLWLFAVAWSRVRRRGPLEGLISLVVRAVVRPVAGRSGPGRGGR